MQSKQGRTLNGVGLSQGNMAKDSTAKPFEGATTFHCVADGDLQFNFVDGTNEIVTFSVRDSFPVECKSILIKSGTFHIGFD